MGTTDEPGPEVVVGASIHPSGMLSEWSGANEAAASVVLRPLEPEIDRAARILVVEDEHLVALDIADNLSRGGHNASVVHSGEDAIRLAAAEPFDLVVMDIRLGGAIDGIEAAAVIHEASDVPIIYLTAYADDRTLDRARRTEPYGYVLKPFQERELRATIEMALQRYRGERLRWEQLLLQRFLADASARMTASLDYRSVARGAAELLVPRYADWCEIRLKRSNDVIPELTLWHPNGHHSDPGKLPKLFENVEASARAALLTDIADDRVLGDALGVEHLDALHELGARSVLCVPLIVRDHTLGALALVAGRNRPRFADTDLEFVEDFGRRLATALDNALLYRKAERAVAMRDDVLAIVSHDLRTPLGTILLQAELVSGAPEHEKAGRAIMRSAQRMNRLIGDLLDASAINAGHLALDVDVHCAAAITREALEMFRTSAEARDIRMLENTDEQGSIRCDRDRIVQVLSNLLANAVKFTPRGGTITVSTTRDDSVVRFEVRDTGQGIPAEQLPHLFTRFWRAHAGRGGAGLGLFIARGIMAAHGCTLEVDTEEGVGSRFYFSLPIVP
jgi:signal transduction histidine kinase/CheY-like chemotaxis protein